MRVLILNWRDPKNPKSGGAEIVTFRHAKAWVEAGHKVTWFTTKFKDSLDKETIAGIEIVRRGNSLSVYPYAFFYYLFGGKIFDLVIDEIHGVPFFTPLYVRRKKIAFIHEVAQEIWDYMYPFPLNKFGKILEKSYLKLYKNVFFWTDALSTIDDLVKFGINRRLCRAIPCPIENKTLDILPIKEVKPTFIFVSRIVKMKGIENVIKAFLKIKSQEKDARLWILGDGEKKYIAKLKSIVRDYGIERNVNFYGHVSSKTKLELMGRSHLLLHASVREGWGLVVLEAASQGTPTVAYNISGLRDSIKNGKTGITLECNSPEELAKEALFLIRDKIKYKAFQENGMNWAKSLKWDDVTRESLEMIEKAIK